MRALRMLCCLLFAATTAAAQGANDSVSLMSPAVVTANRAKIIFRSSRYEVLDYVFDGDNLLIMADKGTFKHRPVLVLLSPQGDTVAYGALPFYPQKLIKSCAGAPYVLSDDTLYYIRRDDKLLTCEARLPAVMADMIASCQLKLNDNFYYKGGDAKICRVSFARRSLTDTTLRRFTYIENYTAADVVKYNMYMLRRKILYGNFLTEDYGIEYRSREELTEICYGIVANRGYNVRSFGRLLSSSNLYQYGDSGIVITDYLNKKLRYYSDTGAVTGVVPMQQRWSNADNYGILRDDVTGRFYVHFEKNSHTQYLQELQPKEGLTTGPLLTFERQFPERVSVHDGKIYFLQHDPASGSVRQLYVQRW